jgi:hypothetical protein
VPNEAAVYNAFVDAAIAHRARQSRLSGGRIVDQVPPDAVLVKNNTDVALGRDSIVGIGACLITPDDDLTQFRTQQVFEAETPATPDHFGLWGVLTQPLRKDSIGWAQVSGTRAVQVDFDYDDQPYADIADEDAAKLKGGEGGARVIWKPKGTGTQWAVVRLGALVYPKLLGKLDADLTQATGYATMSVWEGETLADSDRNVTVYDWFLPSGKKLASGAKVAAFWASGKWYVDTTDTCPS